MLLWSDIDTSSTHSLPSNKHITWLQKLTFGATAQDYYNIHIAVTEYMLHMTHNKHMQLVSPAPMLKIIDSCFKMILILYI
jgi:hypothetical protein